MNFNIFFKLKDWFIRDTWALPIDIFRILAGILSFVYFLVLFLEVEDFSSLDGLVDHDYFLNNFKWLKINFFQSGTNINIFYGLTIAGCIGSISLIIGYRVRSIAAVLYIIAASIQRWNFAVVYIDDTTMHLVLFWLILLPSGKTLVLSDFIKEGKKCIAKWMCIKVPGIAVNCFLANICWLYFYAGMTKLFSSMWIEGFALYPILLMPISRVQEFITPEYFPFIKIGTYIVLFMEISIPYFLLSAKNTKKKWLGLLLQFSFNIGIIITLRIPFANIALLATSVLFFREELMDAIGRLYKYQGKTINIHDSKIISIVSIVFVILVTISVCRFAPFVKHVAWPATSVLWTVGVVQQYHLFDWIDRFNYHKDQDISFYPSGVRSPLDSLNDKDILPNTIRHSVTELRLYDIRWVLHIPLKNRKEFKDDTRKRIAQRACRKVNENGFFRITTILHRITQDNIDLTKKPMKYEDSFYCINREPLNLRTRNIN